MAEMSPKSEPEELPSRFDGKKRRKKSDELEFGEARPFKLQHMHSSPVISRKKPVLLNKDGQK